MKRTHITILERASNLICNNQAWCDPPTQSQPHHLRHPKGRTPWHRHGLPLSLNLQNPSSDWTSDQYPVWISWFRENPFEIKPDCSKYFGIHAYTCACTEIGGMIGFYEIPRLVIFWGMIWWFDQKAHIKPFRTCFDLKLEFGSYWPAESINNLEVIAALL